MMACGIPDYLTAFPFSVGIPVTPHVLRHSCLEFSSPGSTVITA